MCNMDCFNCTEPDCTNDTITETEKIESNLRDVSLNGFGTVHGGKRDKARKLKPSYREDDTRAF